ncbi:MAG: DNA-binding response regulator [Oceanospirillaceae bacterium]|uniref:response regulator transcription factor n=1 Tax=Thalassolituus sp. UBA3500 TaxID=1947664 RepID=UPI000C119DD2|nr:response regulator transcription factor [Thalassolituus sp. UBA3500]MAE34287.1 DNA-binding response regulator [Oceanospirillaceae bacterium]MBN57577.1 DNA-binding response regulator [Oceanospirillaceae bacterium]|tara:strand:+ start:2466 stop:3404 length:939 start_codon:yes stop_codon:yes gene_type:complete
MSPETGSSKPGTATGNSGTILIVDDTPESLAFMNEALAGAGYTVLVAMDGEQALNIARLMTPDLILMDGVMPRMDGFETCRALKASPDSEDVPVIFLTGLSDSSDVLKGLEAGGVDYLTKPVNLDEMLARVQVHLSTAMKTKSARRALEEMGQPAFACDVNGTLLWATRVAEELLGSTGAELASWQPVLSQDLPAWLTRSPERNAMLRLTSDQAEVSVRYLGRPLPGEYLMRFVLNEEVAARKALQAAFDLTDRETQVLFWLSRGKTNQEIAQILEMSPRTVNKHLEPVFRKLGVENRTAAVATALAISGQQ